MFTSLRDSFALLALIALLPGAISWWSGRRLARLVDDPALPELLAAYGRRNGAALVIAVIGLACVASWTSLALTVPLVFAGLHAAAYPLRRVLYHETWSFATYFWFFPRGMGGIFGFWLVLGAMPALAALAGERDWLAGAGLAGLLVVWNHYYADVVRFCLRTRPIAEGEFLSRCRALADACRVPQPRFERIDLEGGVIANALALPSLRTSTVLFTDTVLERFDQQELLAICAHELAHFEHYNPAYLRRLNIVTWLLIALGAVVAPLSRMTGLDSGLLPQLLWLGAFLSTLAMRARGKQRQETACDLRAVELTGDADAAIRSLTKLYTIARIPRRMEQQTERSATHPSLARRVRDLRKAAGVAPAVIGGPHSFTSADGRTVVTFDDVEVRWAERDAVTHSFEYTHLTELRVDARARSGPCLVALGAAARRWEMRLTGSDVGRLQSVLDVVDGRLADPPQRTGTPLHGVEKIIVMTAAALVLLLSHVAVAFVVILAWVKPSAPLLTGAGLAALTAAGLVARDHSNMPYATGLALPLAVIGLALLGFAWSHRHDAPDGMRRFIALLAVPAALSAAALVMNGVDVVRLHQSARTMPFATVLMVALAGALACSKVRRERLVAGAVGVLALATTVAGSTAFLDRFAADPFLIQAPALTWVSVGSDPIGEFDVPTGTSRIELSPNGQSVYVAAYQSDDSGEDHASTFQIGRIGATLTSIAADDLAFVDDDRLLVVQSEPRGTMLRVVRLNPSRDVIWQQLVEDLSAPSLSLDRDTGSWRLLGRGDDESIVRVDGVIGTAGVQTKRWPAAHTRGNYIAALTAAGPDMLVVETRYDRSLLALVIPWQWTWAHMLQPYSHGVSYATVSDRGRRMLGESNLDVNCMAGVLAGDGLACTVYDGTRTHVVGIDATTGTVEGIGFLAGHFVSDQNVVRGWLTGWASGHAVAIRLSTGDVLHLPGRRGPTSLLSVANGQLAAVMMGEGHFTVRLFPLPPEMPAADGIRAQRTP